LAFLGLGVGEVLGQTTYYFQPSSGNPATVSNWNTLEAGGGTSPANFTGASDIFIIPSGKTAFGTSAWTVTNQVTVMGTIAPTSTSSNNYTAKSWVIESTGIVLLQQTAGIVIATNGTFTCSGLVRFNRSTSLPGSLTLSTGATATMLNGGAWHHQETPGGNIPTMTWEIGSTCRVTRTTSTTTAFPISSLNQEFYNLEWDYNNSSANIFEANPPRFKPGGTLTIKGTGTGFFGLANTTTARSWTIENLVIEGGTFFIQGINSSDLAHTLTINGNFKQNAGIFHLSRLSTANSNFPILNVKGNFELSGTGVFGLLNVINPAAGIYGILNFNGTSEQTYTGTVAFNGSYVRVNVKTGAMLFIPKNNYISGGYNSTSGFAQFNVEAGAMLKVGNADGFVNTAYNNSSTKEGAIRMNGTKSYSTSANYGYESDVAQVTGNGLPATVNNLTINNSHASGVNLTNNVTVSNTLGLSNGQLNLNSNTLTLANNANIISSGGSLSGAPTFGTSVNVTYNQHTGAITTGHEIPTSTTVLNNITVNNTNGVNLNANATVNGNLTVNNSGLLNLGANTLNRATSGGTLTLGENTTLQIGGTNTFPVNYTTHTLNETSLIEYNGTAQQVAALPGPYGIVTLSNEGEKTFASGAVIINLNIEENGTARLNSGRNITVKEKLDNGGVFTIENNANLIQEGTTNNNVGSINVLRESSALWRLDYTLWSSPVANQNLSAFSPLTIPLRFYVYNPIANVYNSITPSTNSFATGVGYLIRMPDSHPSQPSSALKWGGEFLGVPHNGNITLTVVSNTYNAIGNPYTSTIDANEFISVNNLTEALYFWRKTNAAAGSAYATYTLAGGAGTGGSGINGSGSQVPNGIIQVGQGFIARSTSTSLVFNNSMRVGNNANQFLRMSELEHNRVRLAMAGPNNFTQNILVNYMTGATNDVDLAIDGKYINDSETAFYTMLDAEAYVIQGRALPFDTQDIVPLGFKTTQTGNYTINLIDVDGLFEQEQLGIYLRDLDLNIIHDLDTGAYTFASDAGVFHNRFELIYQNEVMSVPQNGTTTPGILYTQGNEINLHVGSFELEGVRIFDLAGRLIYEQSLQNVSEISMTLPGVAKQALLAQYQIKDLGTFTKKIIF
jgi:hypothetical protein